MNVYLDNAATTPVAPEVVEAMIPVLFHTFGNPSSTHAFGRQAKALLENSRRSIAQTLNCAPSELIFTSGGTEADNMALHAAVTQLGVKRIITTAIEHHAVGHTAEALKVSDGIDVVYLTLDEKGNINLQELEQLLQEQILTSGTTYSSMPTHHLPNGVYFLQITTTNQQITKKIVINHKQ